MALPERGAVELRRHVNDVGPHRDVDRRRDLGPVGGDEQALVQTRTAVLDDNLAERAVPRPLDWADARSQAFAKSSDVSRANPNSPDISREPTSSLVRPATASSRS